MDAKSGWMLALVGLVVGWMSYGWPGVALATSVIVFWLLLQFSRALRVMRNAADSPLAQVPSAVMLQARLKPGLTMMQVVGLTRSLGRKLQNAEDDWRWEDAGGVGLVLHFDAGRLKRWTLERPDEAAGRDDAVGTRPRCVEAGSGTPQAGA